MKKGRCSIYLVVLGMLTLSCVKETRVTQSEIVPGRQANPDVKESIQVVRSADGRDPDETSKTFLEIKKTALGRAFLLLPNAKLANHNPQWTDFKPVIVSFERSGTKLGLFKLTSNNLYAEIPTDKLIQSFVIISENETSIRFDLSQGIQSFPTESPYEIILPMTLPEDIGKKNAGIESSIELKDVFVRSVKIDGNRIIIEQPSRIRSEIMVERNSPNEPNKKIMERQKIETSATLLFELRPYSENPNFKRVVFDREQRLGSFLTLVSQPNQDNPVPYIMKWDVSPERGTITLAISDNTPTEVIPAIIEAGQYWNRLLGREVFVPAFGIKAGDLPQERTLIVRWIPWDSAGFAYAIAQADPLTGEILRGQIFLTSSWYKISQAVLSPGFSLKTKLTTDVSELNETKAMIQKTALCIMDQGQVTNHHAGLSVVANSTGSGEMTKKISLDVIRHVIAHEMGHLMGMRHNFVGSSTKAMPDSEIIKLTEDYAKEINHPGAPLSTTTMDYTDLIQTAVLGAFIKENVLLYDQGYINWAYYNHGNDVKKGNYCSDEHIMRANTENKSIYGCERGDSFSNPLFGRLYNARLQMKNMIRTTWKRLYSQVEGQSIYSPTKKFVSTDVSFLVQLQQVVSVLYLADGVTFQPWVSVSMSLDKLFDSSPFSPYESSSAALSEKLEKDIKEVGGIFGILAYLIPKDQPKDFYSKQASEFFENLNPEDYPLFSKDETAEWKKIFTDKAAEADANLITDVAAALMPSVSNAYSIPAEILKLERPEPPPGTPAKPPLKYFWRGSVGPAQIEIQQLFDLYRKNVISRRPSQTATIDGKPLLLEFENTSIASYSKYNLSKYTNPENWPLSYRKDQALFAEEKELFKRELIKNTLQLFEVAGIAVPQLDYSSLYTLLSQIQQSRLDGVDLEEFKKEISLLFLAN